MFCRFLSFSGTSGPCYGARKVQIRAIRPISVNSRRRIASCKARQSSETCRNISAALVRLHTALERAGKRLWPL